MARRTAPADAPSAGALSVAPSRLVAAPEQATSRRRLRDRLAEPWCVLDTETTGLGPRDEVVEVAAVGRRGGVLFDSLVQPRATLTRESARIHGLGVEQLRGAPAWPDVWPQLRVVLESRTLFAFHAAFDVRMLRQTCARHGSGFALRRVECVRAWARRILGRDVHSLASAAERLGLDPPVHRAASDARLARDVLLRLAEPQQPGDRQSTR